MFLANYLPGYSIFTGATGLLRLKSIVRPKLKEAIEVLQDLAEDLTDKEEGEPDAVLV